MKHSVKFILVILFFFHGLTYAQERLIEKGNEKLGNSYYYNADYKDAADTYKKLVAEYTEEVSAEDYFKYAQTLKTLGDYDTSNSVMTKFKEITKGDGRANAFTDERDFMKEIKKNSDRYNLGTFEYNSPYSDFAPSFFKEGLIFSGIS